MWYYINNNKKTNKTNRQVNEWIFVGVFVVWNANKNHIGSKKSMCNYYIVDKLA